MNTKYLVITGLIIVGLLACGSTKREPDLAKWYDDTLVTSTESSDGIVTAQVTDEKGNKLGLFVWDFNSGVVRVSNDTHITSIDLIYELEVGPIDLSQIAYTPSGDPLQSDLVLFSNEFTFALFDAGLMERMAIDAATSDAFSSRSLLTNKSPLEKILDDDEIQMNPEEDGTGDPDDGNDGNDIPATNNENPGSSNQPVNTDYNPNYFKSGRGALWSKESSSFGGKIQTGARFTCCRKGSTKLSFMISVEPPPSDLPTGMPVLGHP